MRRHAIVLPLYLWAGVSLMVHMGSVAGTSTLAARRASMTTNTLSSAGQDNPGATLEVVFDPLPAPTTLNPARPPAVQPPAPVRERERPREVPVPPPPRTPRAPTPRIPLRVTLAPTPAPPPPPPRAQRPPVVQYVHQNTPSEASAPSDPHYLAESNRTVEEETIARVRNLQQDAPNPQLGGTPRQSQDTRPGNADRQVSADDRAVQGDRNLMPHEDTRPRPQRPDSHTPTALRASTLSAGNQRPPGDNRSPGERGGSSGDPPPGDTATLNPPTAPGDGGPRGDGGERGQSGQQGDAATRLGIRGLGAARALAMLSPSYSQYEAIVGTEALERERRTALQRRSEARGSYTDQWQQTRAAIENFTPTVRVGNQTALRTAASPFAAYLTDMHRRIHRLFADGFLAGLDALPSTSPLQDESLHVTLEIVLERSGQIHRLGIVSMSGVLPFDVAALNSVRRAAPFGNAPEAILSGDGRVYLHWGFYRSQRQCGTFNVEPYILPHPAGGANEPRDAQPLPLPGGSAPRPEGA